VKSLPWHVARHQTQRGIRARCFDTVVEDLRILLREVSGSKAQLTPLFLAKTFRSCLFQEIA
jgi:hypothetical protein